VRIIEHHQTDKLGMFRREIADERNDILPLLVSASGINLLRGSSFARDRKARNGSSGSGAAVTYNAAQRIADFPGGFRSSFVTWANPLIALARSPTGFTKGASTQSIK
jgi:hypothetical protein